MTLEKIVQDIFFPELHQSVINQNWSQIKKLMEGRPQDIKNLIWKLLPKSYQEKIRQLKNEQVEKVNPKPVLPQVIFKVGDLVAAADPYEVKYLWHGVVEKVLEDTTEVFVFWQERLGTATNPYEVHEVSYLRKLN